MSDVIPPPSTGTSSGTTHQDDFHPSALLGIGAEDGLITRALFLLVIRELMFIRWHFSTRNNTQHGYFTPKNVAHLV